MTDLPYEVTVTSADGNSSLARFAKPGSAYAWAKRLRDDGADWSALKVSGEAKVPLTLAQLKKEADQCKQPKRRHAAGSKFSYRF